ncbi:MAG: UDP-glucose/GDP-mannose dehydrogenase family protein [Rhizobiaceae bacterium]|nr:UDP-glucose/GDP-mannose dehydrogenase family protein [Rhizobiaceae bacterium]
MRRNFNTILREDFQFPQIEAQKKPSISVIGLGYVGAVSTACLAELGHEVIGVDLDREKVESISIGVSPIHENRLSELLTKGVESGLITATTDVVRAVAETDVTFVSVGTPTSEDGGCDCRYIVSAAQAIGQALQKKDDYHVVVMRCSIPPSTTMEVMVPEIEKASGKRMGSDFGVCFNPEFLREGTAIADFDEPPKTVIGASDDRAANVIRKIYEPVDENIIITSIDVAEMVKYVDNVWHATKVSFGNEVGRICKPIGIDSHKVMEIFVQDTKLNLSPYYLKPGFAYGGSCLPKEVRAVEHLANEIGVDVPLIKSLARSNDRQIQDAIDMIRVIGARKVGFLGIAFKPGTDDLRESPVLELMDALFSTGHGVCAFDPAIGVNTRVENQFEYVKNACPHLEETVRNLPKLLRETPEDVMAESDVVVVSQNNQRFVQLVVSNLHQVKVVDLVRLFPEPPIFTGYYGIGW